MKPNGFTLISFICLKDAELKASAEAGPSSQGSTEPWDTPFNRVTNKFKDRDMEKLPTSAGCVPGFGTSMKVAEYYQSDAKTRKERRTTTKDKAEVLELKKKFESLEKKVESVDKLVDARVRQLIPPGLMEGLAAWNAAGQKGPIPVPSFTGSNSSLNKQVSPELVTPQPPLLLVTSTPPAAAVLDNAPERPENNDRPAADTGALASTPAELDAITKVTN